MRRTHHRIIGPISPLPTILGNVPIILMVLQIILSDFPLVGGVLKVTEPARKNVGLCRSRPDGIRSEILMCGGSKMVKSRIFWSLCLWSLTFRKSHKIKKIFLCVPSISLSALVFSLCSVFISSTCFLLIVFQWCR